jgi:hypothetical protein
VFVCDTVTWLCVGTNVTVVVAVSLGTSVTVCVAVVVALVVGTVVTLGTLVKLVVAD